jgi:hypothetical protein
MQCTSCSGLTKQNPQGWIRCCPGSHQEHHLWPPQSPCPWVQPYDDGGAQQADHCQEGTVDEPG